MADQYAVSPNGNDNNSGSLESPWRTLDRAIKASGANVTVLPGTYAAPKSPVTSPVSLNAPEPVFVGPWQAHGGWTQTTIAGRVVWTASLTGGSAATQAVWSSDGVSMHRVPVWSHSPGIETPEKWAAAVLSEANTHTRWGLHSTSTVLYLIPPVDGSFNNPNEVAIWASGRPGFSVNGSDIQLTGLFTIACATSGILLNATAQRTVIDGREPEGLRVFGCKTNIAIRASGSGATTQYGRDHVLRNLLLQDNGAYRLPGEQLVPHQRISWHIIKSGKFDLGIRDVNGAVVPVQKPLNGAESCGLWTNGGAINVLFEDSTIDGTFDGASHYAADSDYDPRCDSGLVMRRIKARNHADDVLDRSRHQDGVLIEDWTAENVAVVFSPAPLWGTVTLRRFKAWQIGDQCRIPDGTGDVPVGSVVKYGANEGTHPQGQVYFEDFIAWTDNPTTRGIVPYGGDGATVPRLSFKDSTIRVGKSAVDWGRTSKHPLSWFVFDTSTRFSAVSEPLRVQSGMVVPIVTPSVVDASYPDPKHGVFTTEDEPWEDPEVIAELTKELEEEHALRLAAEGQLILERARANALEAERDDALELAAARGDRIADWKAARSGLEQAP